MLIVTSETSAHPHRFRLIWHGQQSPRSCVTVSAHHAGLCATGFSARSTQVLGGYISAVWSCTCNWHQFRGRRGANRGGCKALSYIWAVACGFQSCANCSCSFPSTAASYQYWYSGRISPNSAKALVVCKQPYSCSTRQAAAAAYWRNSLGTTGVRVHGSATVALATARTACGVMKSSWPLWLVLLLVGAEMMVASNTVNPTD